MKNIRYLNLELDDASNEMESILEQEQILNLPASDFAQLDETQ